MPMCIYPNPEAGRMRLCLGRPIWNLACFRQPHRNVSRDEVYSHFTFSISLLVTPFRLLMGSTVLTLMVADRRVIVECGLSFLPALSYAQKVLINRHVNKSITNRFDVSPFCVDSSNV